MPKVNGTERPDYAGLSIAQMLEEMELAADRVAVERNGQIVPHDDFTVTTVDATDCIEVVRFVGGG
ncbi:MAG: sulfur carrier protein ThiS [Coriobacteriaceae bacterium]|nr:sulfur carrier protein ThiS [Coriobacteriaceae bacterium]